MAISDEVQFSNLALPVLLALLLFITLRAISTSSKANVPVVGSSAFFGYLTAIKTPKDLRKYMFEGYKKYGAHAFQIPAMRAWVVFVGGKYVDELRKAREDTLSIQEELNDLISMKYTLGSTMSHSQWHINIIRKQLTSNLAEVFPEVYDEVRQGWTDELGPFKDGEWKSVLAFDTVLNIVVRAGNRMFVGLPLCRDPVYTKASREFTPTVSKTGFYISLFPSFLKPVVARLLSKLPKAVKEFEAFYIPLIKERQRLASEFGDNWVDRPNDFLQWMLDSAEGDQNDTHDLTMRMLTMNFAATHTTSMTFTHALYYLAANPQYIAPLREEVELAVKEYGWTKDALNAMNKIDSFFKETTRLNSIVSLSMSRKVMKPFTFSDGTTLPAGAHVSANLYSVHHDPSIYPDPEKFDPFRFSRKVEAGEPQVKNLLTTAGSEFLTFGYGAHACPGRYFASQELKAMMAYVCLHYDVRMPEDGVRPPDMYFERNCIPNKTAHVLFRKRQV